MCVIAVCERRKLTKDEIVEAWRYNFDGVGVAYPVGKRQAFTKGFMRMDTFLEFYERFDALPHVVHFRLGTSGGVGPVMTHPFPCTVPPALRLAGVVSAPLLFHNGVEADWQKLFQSLLPFLLKRGRKATRGPWNDTRTVALAVALGGEDVLHGFSGKFVVVSGGRIRLYGYFTEENGVRLSAPIRSSIYGYGISGCYNVSGLRRGDWRYGEVKKNGGAVSGCADKDAGASLGAAGDR